MIIFQQYKTLKASCDNVHNKQNDTWTKDTLVLFT